jgi:hypothetical protein
MKSAHLDQWAEFDKLRGVVREWEKEAAGFDHDHFSKEKLPARDMTSTRIPFYWPNGWSPESSRV